MAASLASLRVSSSSSLPKDLIISARSEALKLTKACFPVPAKKKTIRSVKAMGVAKHKGTYMREHQLTEMIEKKVSEAKKACEGDGISDECKVAWDEVEEISQAKADLRLKMEKQDPLEYFCQDNPETDECRIYED